MMRDSRKWVVAVVFFILFPVSTANAAITLLHEFAGGVNDGAWPFASPIQDGSVLYGTAYMGGGFNYGVVFKVNKDSSGFQLLHEFDANTALPMTALIQDGSVLFGTTYESRGGVVYRMHKDGSGYQILHQFSPEAADGEHPAALTQDVSVLYGTTSHGGSGHFGVVYRINKDGSGFQLLHEFAGGGNDGAYCFGSLILDGSVLYGMTSGGGDSNLGVLFRINKDGSGFQLLHEFAGGGNDGASPFNELVQDGSVLYGVAGGGDYNQGVIFRINKDGSGFQLLHEFAGGGADGSGPVGSLVLGGSRLYGMTNLGGDFNKGVAYQINKDGSGFQLLHEFAGGGNDGASPYASLIQDGSVFYGMTAEGGDSNLGVLFSLALAGASRDISGCVIVKGDPLVGKVVTLSQTNESRVTALTNGRGCYHFNNAVSGKEFNLRIRGGLMP